MALDQAVLQNKLTLALEASVAWRGYVSHPNSENAYRSAYFCYQVGCLLDETIGQLFESSRARKRQVCFDNHGEKVAGEWLLDIVWSEEYKPDDQFQCAVPKRIVCAVECESSTSINEFFVDLAKLLNVRSPIKLFLAGLNQTTPRKADEYQQMRLKQAAAYITESEPVPAGTDWYIAFWPSPKGKKKVSLWDSFDKHPHLNSIQLFRYESSSFVPCVSPVT